MGWQSKVEDLLYESESVEEIVDIDNARVVVTSHRVLTFTPEMDGENFEQVERPNVTGVTTSAIGPTGLAAKSIRYGVYSALLVLAGVFVDFGSFIGGIRFDAQSLQGTGASGLAGTAQGMLNLFSQLDELMRTFGALGLLVAVAIFAVYWLLRTPTLVISVAGDGEDLHVPRPDDPDLAVTALEEAILIDEQAGDSGRLASMLPEDIF
ncbi:hypothetical protein GRX03_03070 [Halovenus sp. WSH3]|uniref:Uncharacterized protein n=1 Tax=Halovenus carboxidivorans TaxID=2692199 RepID=A0A6B0T5U0_9EURY|nr:hypothetical protein [Halovenus carboxidivorans]MXR50591.1 hypothetical protein [Halovenus carboxidivorans]